MVQREYTPICASSATQRTGGMGAAHAQAMRVQHLGQLVRHAAGVTSSDSIQWKATRYWVQQAPQVMQDVAWAAASGGSRNQERGCGFSTKWAAAQEIP
jgi:hypothetical protein